MLPKLWEGCKMLMSHITMSEPATAFPSCPGRHTPAPLHMPSLPVIRAVPEPKTVMPPGAGGISLVTVLGVEQIVGSLQV